MTVESAADRAAFFNADEFGAAAVYTPPGGGSTIACTVLLDRADKAERPGDGRPLAAQKTITVRKAELAAPVKGGTFAIGASTYTILERPRAPDPDGVFWVMWVHGA